MVEAGSVRLAAREWPSSARTAEPRGGAALLLHGLASSSHIWDLVGPRLAAGGLRTVAYDQRGHGRSGKPGSGYGFDRTAGDAAAVVRAFRLGRPIVVGHSWGANVALELAVRRPESVGSLVLLDGGFLALRERMDWSSAKEVLAPPNLRGTPVDEFLGWARSELGRVLDITPEIEAVLLSLMYVDRDRRIRQRLSRANHLRILRAIWLQDPTELLRRVGAPTLVLAVRAVPGTPDSAGFLAEKERGAALVRRIGGPVRFEWISGIHDIPLQRPDAVANRILRIARGP